MSERRVRAGPNCKLYTYIGGRPNRKNNLAWPIARNVSVGGKGWYRGRSGGVLENKNESSASGAFQS